MSDYESLKVTLTVSDYESLKVTLTDEEVSQYAAEWAALDETIRLKEDEAKRAAKKYKEDLDALDSRSASLAQRVRERKEYRDVLVDDRKDYRRQVITTYRTDTGEVIRERTMTFEELQTEIPLPLATAESKARRKRAKPDSLDDIAAYTKATFQELGVECEVIEPPKIIDKLTE